MSQPHETAWLTEAAAMAPDPDDDVVRWQGSFVIPDDRNRRLRLLCKPRWLIEAFGLGQFGIVERRLINALLVAADEVMNEDEPPHVLVPCAAELRRHAGLGSERDNRRLWEALDRLQRTWLLVNLPGAGWVCTCLIDSFEPFGGHEHVEIQVNPLLAPHLQAFPTWAKLNFDALPRFTSYHALTLYELLTLKVRMNRPVLDVTEEELRKRLGLLDRLRDAHALYRKALRPALAEIDRLTDLQVGFEAVKARRERRVQRYRFKVEFKRETAAKTEHLAPGKAPGGGKI